MAPKKRKTGEGSSQEASGSGSGHWVIPESPSHEVLDQPMPQDPGVVGRRTSAMVISVKRIKPGSYCSFRFVSHTAHLEAYTDTYLKKNGQSERLFPVHAEMPDQIKDIYEREKLTNWFKLVGKSSVKVAREFCLNLRHVMDGESQDPRLVYCRGKWIVFTPETIRIALGFPKLTQPCAYHAEMRDVNIFERVNAFCFAKGIDPWVRRGFLPSWKAEKKFFAPHAKWILELLENWVLGITVNPTFSFKMSVVALCLWDGKRVDIPKMIWANCLERTSAENKLGPGHTCLLTHLVRTSEARIPGGDMVTEPPAPRVWSRFDESAQTRSKGKQRKSSKYDNQVAYDALRAEMARDRMESRRQFAHTRSNQAKLGSLIEMVGRWVVQSSGRPGAEFDPPAPSTAPWFQEDEYEEPAPSADEDDEELEAEGDGGDSEFDA